MNKPRIMHVKTPEIQQRQPPSPTEWEFLEEWPNNAKPEKQKAVIAEKSAGVVGWLRGLFGGQ
ncbi:MAG TPA: hypothetical protein VGQ00_04625 [Candidatus Norongarragalinales archaeon]|nr:hypothetical protein [Candidatus Norongarragalinales archaeon]